MDIDRYFRQHLANKDLERVLPGLAQAGFIKQGDYLVADLLDATSLNVKVQRPSSVAGEFFVMDILLVRKNGDMVLKAPDGLLDS